MGPEPVCHLHMVLVLFKAILWASLCVYGTSVKTSRGECLDDYFGVWLQPVVHPKLLLAYSCCSLILTSLSTICATADLLLHPGVWNWESCTSFWWKLLLLLWEQWSSGQIWTCRNQWSMMRGPVWKTLCPLYSPRLLHVSCTSPWSGLSSPQRPGRASPPVSRSLLMYWMNRPSRTQEVFLELIGEVVHDLVGVLWDQQHLISGETWTFEAGHISTLFLAHLPIPVQYPGTIGFHLAGDRLRGQIISISHPGKFQNT